MSAQFSPKRNHALIAVMLAVTALVSACDRPSDVAAPDGVTPQLDHGGSHTNVQFKVTRADDGEPVENATISIYLDETSAPTWLTTDEFGLASISAPTGVGIGYLARLHPPDWYETNQVPLVAPPLDPGLLTTVDFDDLGALTCGRRGPVQFTPGLWSNCLNNRYFIPRGPTELVELSLPVLGARGATVKDPSGNSSGAFVYLITDLEQYTVPWLSNLPAGVKPGFLRFYGATGSNFKVPKAKGVLEAYGSVGDIEFAGTALVEPGDETAVIETSPVVCANGEDENVVYTLTRAATNAEFSFTGGTEPAALWAYAAKRGTSEALDKDLTTTVIVLKFAQFGGPATVDISQRHRVGSGTQTASVSVSCTNGICDVANAVYSVPGAGNLMKPQLFQPKAGKLFLVVEGLDPTADSEWSAKATKLSGKKVVQLDQLPDPSKSTASSANLPFSKAFSFCDVNFSFDGGWGCGI